MVAKTTLYHPRGPAVEIELDARSPADMLGSLQSYLDAGWLAYAPGLEVGEGRDNVGWVVRGEHEGDDGRATSFVLLYSVNEALKHSFLKVYLNRDEDAQAFEFASKLKLDAIPLYIGKDKPERGASKRTDQHIVKAPKPFGVVFKSNPRYSAEEAKAAKAADKLYNVPKRVFVRWQDQRPAEPETAPPPEEQPIDKVVETWTKTIKECRSLSDLQTVWTSIYKSVKPHQLPALEIQKDVRKRELSKAA